MSESEQWYPVADEEEIEEDDVVCVTAGDRKLAVFHLEEGGYHATDNRCTHAEASLADGYLEGDTIECPRHQGVFHVPTGKPMSAPVIEALRVYPTKVEDGRIWVRVSE